MQLVEDEEAAISMMSATITALLCSDGLLATLPRINPSRPADSSSYMTRVISVLETAQSFQILE